MSMVWQEVQYPQREFYPPGDPSEWFETVWMAAIDQSAHQTATIPVLPIEYVYGLPSVFFQMEPDDQVNPAYLEAWQNLSTTLMPVYDQRYISGDIPNMPYSTLQLAVGVQFGPNGLGEFLGPALFDILEGPPDFEIRTPT